MSPPFTHIAVLSIFLLATTFLITGCANAGESPPTPFPRILADTPAPPMATRPPAIPANSPASSPAAAPTAILSPTSTPLPTPIPSGTIIPVNAPTLAPTAMPSYEDQVVGAMMREYFQVADDQQGDAFMGTLLVGAELCQSAESGPIPADVRQRAFEEFTDTMVGYEQKAQEAGRDISHYRDELFEEAIRMAVRCGMKVDVAPTSDVAPTPNVVTVVIPYGTPIPNPTQRMERTVADAVYITDNDWRLPVSRYQVMCVGADLTKRSFVLYEAIKRLEIRSNDSNYVDTPEWHREIQRVAGELAVWVAEYDKLDC